MYINVKDIMIHADDVILELPALSPQVLFHPHTTELEKSMILQNSMPINQSSNVGFACTILCM